MTRTALGFCAAAVFGMAVSAGAQTGTASSSSQDTMHKANEVKVTGCLERSASGGYILTNATKAEGTEGTTGEYGSAAGTSGTSQPGTSSSMKSGESENDTFKLEGSATELAKHVGHKIEVTANEMNASSESGAATGTSGSASGTMSGSASGSTSGTATSSTEKGANAPRLDVQSVRMISSTCS